MLTPNYRTPSLRGAPVANVSWLRWRYVAMLMLGSGSVLIEFGVFAGLVHTTRPDLVHSAAGMFVLLAAITPFVRPGQFRAYTRLVVLTTIIEITLLARSFEGIATVPVYYVWPLLGAAYLLTRADVVVFTLLSIIGFATAAPAPQLGVADYVSITVVSLVVVLTVRALAENLSTTIRSLRKASSTDPLTGLLNRRALDYYVAQERKHAAGSEGQLSVVILDIDHFKQINDRYGHAAGDAALVRFSELLIGACRGTDRIARIGGEEFAIIMPGASARNALERATRFANTLRADHAVDGIHMTVSAGIATAPIRDANWDALLTDADHAVYEAKHAGRDRIVVARQRGLETAADLISARDEALADLSR
jgi:diguanylate cyclase (GGDEF)-like protein